MKKIVLVLSCLLLCSGPRLWATNILLKQQKDSVGQERTYTVMELDLAYLMNLWPGGYDNVEQLYFDKCNGKEGYEKGDNIRIHSVIERVDLPALGSHVSYMEAYLNDNPGLYDQGGKFEFDHTDGRHMVLGMRTTWSVAMQWETFVVFIQEEDQKEPAPICSWAEPDS